MRYFLILCSLILLGACSNRKSAASVAEIKVQTLTAKSIEEMIGRSQKPYHLLNFYATYCKPCIKEIPELISLKTAENSEVEVSFISVDDAQVIEKQLSAFLQEQNMDFPSYAFAQDSATAYIRKHFPDWNQQIPLSLLFDKSGKLIAHLPMTDRAEIELIVSEDKNFK